VVVEVALAVGDVVGLGLEPALGDGLPGLAVGEALPDFPGVVAPPLGPVLPLGPDTGGESVARVSAWSPPCLPLDEGACGAAQWVNGACGPPVTAMTMATTKAARTAMEAMPANRSTWRRRPDGSANTGLDSTGEW
jgi:hypothetical protein